MARTHSRAAEERLRKCRIVDYYVIWVFFERIKPRLVNCPIWCDWIMIFWIYEKIWNTVYKSPCPSQFWVAVYSLISWQECVSSLSYIVCTVLTTLAAMKTAVIQINRSKQYYECSWVPIRQGAQSFLFTQNLKKNYKRNIDSKHW